MLYTVLATLLAQEEHPPAGGETTAPEAGGALEVPRPPAEGVFNIPSPFGDLTVTNTIIMAWVVIAVLVLFAFLSTRKMRLVPTGAQNFWELVVELWTGIVEQTMGRKGRRFVPLIATTFLFILFSNWMGILPFVGNVTVRGVHGTMVPLLRSANSDLNMTAAMAVLVIIVAEVFEFRSLGVVGYFKGLFWPNFLRWLEIATRPLSLAFRLFGNIFAGEVLVVTMLGIAPVAVFAFLGLEIFVGFIQAIVFSMLTMVFLTMATMHEHAHDDHARGHGSQVAGHGEAPPPPVTGHV